MKKKEKFYEFYVYVTRHGCYSETAVLHVGYQEYRPRTYGSSYQSWHSEPVSEKYVDYIHDKVHYLDGNYTSDTGRAIDIIKKYIKECNEKG